MTARRTRYWHGGAPGLRVGSVLRPADQLAPDVRRLGLAGDNSKVFVTTDTRLARYYASSLRAAGLHGWGTLYNVQPRGPLVPDPDLAGFNVSWACESAKIVAVVEERVFPNQQLWVYGAQFKRWTDGTPMYTHDGYANPSLAMIEHGFSAEHLRPLGLLPEWTEVNHAFTQWALQNLDRDTLRQLEKTRMSPRDIIDAHYSIESTDSTTDSR